MLDWNDLPETVTRRRTTGTTQTARGKLLAASVDTQPIQCLIQPHRGNLKYEMEGTLQDVTEAMYCNPVARSSGGVPTDLLFMDTIIRASGQCRRVAFVADEGGQGDHFKVYLIAVSSGTGGADAGGGSAGNLPPTPSVQAQIAALTAQVQQLGQTIMAYEPNASTGVIPKVPITATVTLTLPAQDTRYPVNITANTVISLPASDGSGKKLYFDFDSLSTFTCTLALNGTDAYVTPLPVIQTGASFALVSDAAGKWSIE